GQRRGRRRARAASRSGGRLAAFLVTGYVFLLLRFTGFVGVLIGPLLVFPAITWADALSERRALSLPPDREAARARRRPRR
ncbi:MAG: hypothetical protein H6Q11_759, partial [Acidobacteria bacterium]|nr:hypothetical protein [Acidobacteriota bacterium]